ncbi:ATP-binding SpoIIE family protein phosphatase [Streptomyces sp. G-G2]|uniref:ATP-binding SpoIIE family protein phosphatase n=1 Tax=Streptomyces sp. G-G2 TaxID=3046201 RepID=UPI0024B8AED2|nr:ATP-binding SpoIIE family protein phosphatase [Streptomyces sp. G-G2]MDJ0384184.1 serine/threonine-protein phosphatase [Streptomyces sp. G-G2]
MTEYPTSYEGPQPAAAAATPAPGGSGLPGPRAARRGATASGPEARPATTNGSASTNGPAAANGSAAGSGSAAESDAGADEQGHGKAPAPAAQDTRPGPSDSAPPASSGSGSDSGAGSGPAPTTGPPVPTSGVPAQDTATGRDTAAARTAGGAPAHGATEPGTSSSASGSGSGSVYGTGLGPGIGSGGGDGSGIPGGVDAGAARREGDRLRFVGAATRRIARGIDLDEIVLGLCRATVPTFSDAILVYLRDPLPVGDERPVGPVVLRLRRTDRLRPIDDLTDAVRAADTIGAGLDLTAAVGAGGELDFSQLALVGPQGDLPAAELCEIRSGGALAEVLRGVRPVFGSSAAARAALPELLGADHPVPRGQRAILAPLRGRRRVIGAAVFLRTPDRPAFEQNDLLVAAQLATHTALGIDKAVLYGREAYIADELQRTMLPDSLPQPTGVRLASRYLPAAETARVGGDWYDAIPLPGSRVALVVGDVMGHSMTSAAIMGQLRTTAQTLAQLDLPPAEVLHHLDEQAQRLGSDRMATCLYAVYDPVSHRITIANAGHPPPVLLHLGGRAEVLRVPPGAPIGVGGVDFEAVELDAPAGATLLLYTDGLVESRLRDVWTGIEQLRERLATTAQLTGLDHPPPLEALCDDVLDMLGPGDRDDDIALLAARFEGIAPSDVAYWFLDPEETAPGRARRFARRALTRWGLEELSDSLELLVSEVVTNAVRYAERPVTLRLLRTDVLRCEVGDDSPQLPRQRRARDTDEGGRGLFLVNRMARRWGATRLSSGKVVWFELALPGTHDPR